MKKILIILLTVFFMGTAMNAKTKNIQLRIIETSDVHGCFFPYDFINRKPMKGSLARLSSYTDSLRNIYGKNLLLIDNGDILQGQPVCYYYNYVNTSARNVAADMINYLGYDAETMGNHDVETGHKVYDKWIKEVNCPVLSANIIDKKSGKPYIKPYSIIERDGVRIAILGMITPAIPNWLSKDLWNGLEFEEMTTSARKWMKVIKEQEHADVVIGVFHSGEQGGITTDKYQENAAIKVAKEIPGFDLVLFGHDHVRHNETVTNCIGKPVVCLDPANNALFVADATISIDVNDKNKQKNISVNGNIASIKDEPIDPKFMLHFKPQYDEVNNFVNKKTGTLTEDIYTRDCFFGPCAFSDLILNLELEITKADIAFNAPLQFNTKIAKGDILVSDMFKLYRFENKLYVMNLTGEEIRKHLEMSYDLWVNTMKDSTDHLLLLDLKQDDNQHTGFKNFSFNFDSAAGIDYEVDVTKPNGKKVHILRMSNGQPFDEKKIYKVALNSYRANGGGELLTKGAGIPRDSLESRTIFKSELDQRYYLMKEIEKLGTVTPKVNNNWHFVPEEWTVPAAKRDYKLLFVISNDK
nr:5'-nucleotidase C-terminal domain-containing protein [Prevotella sp.]